ncbi:MAG: acetoacetate decarboxylase family protein, partial [Actinomycetota bacterium]|nr:acetoacetate decarboxylase family protein [Actinomycetota bacterium]
MVVSCPPEPWDLRGQMHLTVWRMPLADLPALPPGLAPVRLGGHALVGTAWVDYEPGGVLTYRELLVAVLVWHGTRLRVSITDIWVDSVSSLRGGRELWGIPKEPAKFDFAGTRYAANTPDGAAIARGTVTPRTGLPGRWPARYTVVQDVRAQSVGVQDR